jgi:hypothetical protein
MFSFTDTKDLEKDSCPVVRIAGDGFTTKLMKNKPHGYMATCICKIAEVN